MNAIFSRSSGARVIWWYPWKASKKLIHGCPYVASTNWSIFDIGNGSFGHARFKSVKSTQTLHLPFFFFTTTVFASHYGKKISLIAPASFSLRTSNLTASTCSLADLLGFYFLGGNDGSTFYIRNSNISILSQPSMLDPIWKYLSVSGNILTLISSSTQPAPSSPRGFCNCYNGASSAVSLCLACLSFQLTATTRHCRATCWFPLMVATPYSKLNLHMQGGRNGPHRMNPGPS